MSDKTLWVEKYRPKTLNEYVWSDDHQRSKVNEWLADGCLPHLLFSGTQGTGKSSLAYLLLDLLNIPECDILKLNGSKERQIDKFQERVCGFVGTWALNDSGIKYVILNEADRLSPYAQDLLRDEMENYASVCRFILTCNHPKRISPALHSRCQGFQISSLDKETFVFRCGSILNEEGVDYDEELLEYCDIAYPDLRKCINLLQQNTIGKKLVKPKNTEETAKDHLIESAILFQNGQYLQARKIIIANTQFDEYDEVYRYFYENLEIFTSEPDAQDEALLVIRNALIHNATVADPEINLAAALVELTKISKLGHSK